MVSFSPVPAGLRAQFGYAKESTYGTSPSGTSGSPFAYSWIGAIQNLEIMLDQQQQLVWRIDGSTRLPQYIIQGARQVESTWTWYPQSVSILTDMITNANSTSYSLIAQNTDTGNTYTARGLVANTITVDLNVGQPVKVTMDLWGQDVTAGLPSYVSFPSDPGVVPFYFTQNSVSVDNATRLRTLSLSFKWTNNLKRVYQFGQPYIRTLPTLHAQANGTMNVTFDDMSDFNNIYAFQNTHTLSILVGNDGINNHYINLSGVAFEKIDIPTTYSDIVTMNIPFDGISVSVS
jgi:hypothetical protein